MGSHGSYSGDMFKMIRLRRDGNYREWAAYVRALLIDAGLDDYLDKEADEKQQEEVKNQKKCKAKLLLMVEGPLIRLVQEATTAKGAWEALLKDHQGTQKTRRNLLLGELRKLAQGSKEAIQSYIDRGCELLAKLKDAELKEADMLLGDAFLQGLKPSLQFCVPLLTHKIDSGFDDVILELKEHTRLMRDVRVDQDEVRADAQLLNTTARKNTPRKETRRCYFCGKTGHLKKDCWQRKKKINEGSGKPNEEEHGGVMMTTANEQGAVLMVEVDDPVQVEKQDEFQEKSTMKDSIVFDSGASHHVFKNARGFYNKRTSAIKSVCMAGGERHEVTCQGDVDILVDGVSNVTLRNVLCVPSVKYNFLSGVQATGKGSKCVLSGNEISIYGARGNSLMKGCKQKGLYFLFGDIVIQKNDTSTAYVNTLTAELVHRRLGHPGVSVTGSMLKRFKNVKGRPFSVHDCRICTSAKQCRVSYEASSSRATELLSLVHMDVMGPFPIPSLGGSRYVLTILDDFSSFAEVHCISVKSDVPKCAMKTLTEWQRQVGKLIKAVRTDNGSEFKGELIKWFQQKGIVHQRSAEYTPEQNGRAERLNRTLMEKARALLQEHALPHEFWGFH